MNTCQREFTFNPGTFWIWTPSAPAGDAWWMFRKSFSLNQNCDEAPLRITAAFQYILYVNGQLAARGPARSFDFRKAYDTVDIVQYLRPGQENVIAILSPQFKHIPYKPQGLIGVLAELNYRDAAGQPHRLGTDQSWKVKQHASFPSSTAGGIPLNLQLQWLEEWFDARQELPGWNAPNFADGSWAQARELGPVGIAPWKKLEPSGIDLLSDDPVLPRSFAAIELARLREGYHIRLPSPSQYFNSAKLYFTEINCVAPAAIRYLGPGQVHVNGQPALANPQTGAISLRPGRNLFLVHQTGYYETELDFILETKDRLAFSAQHLLNRANADWALLPLPTNTVNFPWHEHASAMAPPAELTSLISATDAEQISDELKAQFLPVAPQAGSAFMDVKQQYVFKASGGYTISAIEQGQPRLPADPEMASPLVNPHNLLHGHADAMTINPTPGYDAHFILDFGSETVGHIEFTIEAQTGAIMDVQCFEKTNWRGIAWMEWGCKNGFRYICREGKQTFVSHFRRGFRFASVTVRNLTRPAKLYSFSSRRASYPVQEIGSFECSDCALNQAYRMSLDTASLCMLDTYVDCPGHEQSFWVGDARITALINLLAFGAYDFNQRCLSLVGQSLEPAWLAEYWPGDKRCPQGRHLTIAAFPNYPDDSPESALPMWSFLWAMQCWDHWLHGANLSDLAENYDNVSAMLRRCKLLTNERGLFDMPGAWNLIEWAANDLSPYGEVTASNLLIVHCQRLAVKMAKALGKQAEALVHDEAAEERQAAINQFCWSEDRQAYVDTVRDEWAYQRYLALGAQRGWEILPREKYHGCLRVSEQTHTLALLCGCVPPERLEVVKSLVKRSGLGRYTPSAPNGRSLGPPTEQEAPEGVVGIGSPFFLFFTLAALYQLGEGDLALAIMRRDWGQMAAQGMRTCPESFGDARSIAHAWSAAPAVYLPANVLGIQPLDPGYKTFTIKPNPGDLQWARGAVATPHGPIYVSWQRGSDGSLEISCQAPQECLRVDS